MLRQFEAEMHDPHLGRLVENVKHIGCSASDEIVVVMSYESLQNPHYSLFLLKDRPDIPTPEELKSMRLESSLLEERERILAAELRNRTSHIAAHKYFVSETMGYDVGLVMGAAAWLAEYGESFYQQCDAHYAEIGSPFRWDGMEKAVLIAAPNKRNEEVHFAIAKYQDLVWEENLAQATGGVLKSPRALGAKARTEFSKLHRVERICILGAPDSFYSSAE
ncbi:MAG: hypothetical protein QW548_00885 [Candidatus Aenigmatarchaeota archaeon]